MPFEDPTKRRLILAVPEGAVTQELPDDDEVASQLVTALLTAAAPRHDRQAVVRPAASA